MASKSVHRVRRVDHESALEYRCRRFTNRFTANPKKPSQRFCNHRGQVDSYISLRWDAIGLKIGQSNDHCSWRGRQLAPEKKHKLPLPGLEGGYERIPEPATKPLPHTNPRSCRH